MSEDRLSYLELLFCEALANKPWHCPTGYRFLSSPLLSHSVMPVIWERGEWPQQGCDVPTLSLHTRGRTLQSQLPQIIWANICKLIFSKMTSRKGPLILSVLQSMIRLISIHCNYSTCSGFGQHFPPQNGLSLKKWPTKENPKLPWDFLLWCTLLFLKAHLTYFSPQYQFKGLHSCSPKLSSLPLSTPSSSSPISGIHICWDLPQQWHAKRGPAGNPLGSTLAAITGDSPTLSAEKEPTLPIHRSRSVAAPEALQSPRGCFPGTNGDPHEC